MTFAFIVYLVGTVFPLLSGIAGLIAGTTITLFITGFLSLPLWAEDEDVRATVISGSKTYLKWALPLAFVLALAPSKEVSYTMIAAYTAQSIGQNEKVQNIAGQSLEVIEAFLEKTKAELDVKEAVK